MTIALLCGVVFTLLVGLLWRAMRNLYNAAHKLDISSVLIELVKLLTTHPGGIGLNILPGKVSGNSKQAKVVNTVCVLFYASLAICSVYIVVYIGLKMATQ